ncbi:hypothetical protein [Flavobacterium sp. UW10123]|uniref:hypothetical protein n=1 Tax=Flavobacterium sp. UW10123 TaxID=3230800 RepID=UPI0025F4FA63|nr:hypothetical protein [uncultured Flavobacterium sp.]
MNKVIRLRVKREIDSLREQKIIKLKGSLIAKGYTDIIHIADENENFYLNTFSTSSKDEKQAEDFVQDYILSNGLTDAIMVLESQ